MAERPSIDTLLMLGAMAPKSQEEGKPTTDVPLTGVEIAALVQLSTIRCRMLMEEEGEDAKRMFAIYLHITSKLMTNALFLSVKPPEENSENQEGHTDH